MKVRVPSPEKMYPATLNYHGEDLKRGIFLMELCYVTLKCSNIRTPKNH